MHYGLTGTNHGVKMTGQRWDISSTIYTWDQCSTLSLYCWCQHRFLEHVTGYETICRNISEKNFGPKLSFNIAQCHRCT